MVNVSTDLNDLKTKVDELDVNGNQLETVTIELKILGHVVSKEIFKKINQVKKKNPDASTLIQKKQYNTDQKNLEKKKDFENKISNISKLVMKGEYDAKTKNIEGKYFTTADYNRFTSDILESKIKQKIGQ